MSFANAQVRFAAIILSVIFHAYESKADLIAFDDFNYTPVGSDLNGQSGGGSFGFSTPWTGNTSFNIGNGSLTSPTGNPVATGNSMTTVAYFENRDIARTLAAPLGAPNTTVYVSLLMRPEGILHQGFAGGWFGLVFRGGAPVVAGMLFNRGDYGVEIAGTQAATNKPAVVGETKLLVLRMDFTEGVDPVRLYVNPTGADEPAVADAQVLSNGIELITSVGLTGPGSNSFDRLAIGTTWADVAPVPEPSAYALAFTGLVGLLAARRAPRTFKK